MLGVMIDCSRNAVLKPERVKEFAKIIRNMGYDTLMLYTEDTYELESQPYFGHLRGKYTKEEIKDIDKYCAEIGIELIPCIQTLAHLNQMVKWAEEYWDIIDWGNALLIGEEKTYDLIREMLKTISECFSSKKIHLGMDEAANAGDLSGKYVQKHGIKDKFEMLNGHLHAVCDIAKECGLEPMIWSDMFVNYANRNGYYDEDCDKAKKEEFFKNAKLPEGVSLVCWDYYLKTKEEYVEKFNKNKMFGRKVSFAGGAWTWQGFAPYNSMSIARTNLAMEACKECGVEDILFTSWGDDGAECSPFTILPTLMFAAEKLNGNTDFESIKKKFYDIVGVDFDSFMLLEKLNYIGGAHTDPLKENIFENTDFTTNGGYTFNYGACKYLLYNDPFMGIRDAIASEADNEYFANLSKQINALDKGGFELLFESYEKLCYALGVKAALGIKTRKAYQENDKNALAEIVKEYDEAIERIKEFHQVYQARWFNDNKPHGFDVQDLRIGGILQRLASCKARLEQFVAGTIEEIPELKENSLPPAMGTMKWNTCVSANIIA